MNYFIKNELIICYLNDPYIYLQGMNSNIATKSINNIFICKNYLYLHLLRVTKCTLYFRSVLSGFNEC